MIDNVKFLNLVCANQIESALKSYADTLLFYKFGQIAVSKSNGNLLEIGVGGSTFPLYELSESTNRLLNLIDFSQDRLSKLDVSCQQYFPGALVSNHCAYSTDIINSQKFTALSYCHIDGDKKYSITRSDVLFCLENLDKNGIICQDDYGNNKHPEVTKVIHDLENEQKLKIVFVGDSSVWVTKPEYHQNWIKWVKHNDDEMKLLVDFLSIGFATDSDFWYRNTNLSSRTIYKDKKIINYFNNLITFNTGQYLQMPYDDQSQIGYWTDTNPPFFINGINKKIPYKLTDPLLWKLLQGPDWPKEPPQTFEDIVQLPHNVKNEIINLHKIELNDIIISNNNGNIGMYAL